MSCTASDASKIKKLQSNNHTSPLLLNTTFLQPGEIFLTQSENRSISICQSGLRLLISILSHDCFAEETGIEMCSGRGVCGIRLTDDTYHCFCDDGYVGNYCEDIDSCLGVICHNNGTCINLPRKGVLETGQLYKCLCADGYLGN